MIQNKNSEYSIICDLKKVAKKSKKLPDIWYSEYNQTEREKFLRERLLIYSE